MPPLRARPLSTVCFAPAGLGLDPVRWSFHRQHRWRRPGPGTAALKRSLDIALAALCLVILSPAMLAIAIAVRLDSPGPALFRQTRIGLHGRKFTMLKFRTMCTHREPAGECPQARRGDPRITHVGHWLRQLSLDELPQLINILRGEMSVVGPRPHAPGTRAGGRLFEEVSQRYTARHSVKPGMTGLAQVRGWRGETATEEMLLRRLDCDLEYIATCSIPLDLAIICRTVGTVVRMRNAW